jgi:hypothetical protein
MDSRIPVCTITKKVAYYLDAASAESLPTALQVRNRRGHLTAIVLKDSPVQLRPTLTSRGFSFVQALPSGHECWALRGVRGSR